MRSLLINTILIISAMYSIQAQQNQLHDFSPKISVNGEAVVKVQPDEIIITFGIETWNKDIMLAKQENNSIMKDAIAVIKNSGIEDKKVQTDYLSIESSFRCVK